MRETPCSAASRGSPGRRDPADAADAAQRRSWGAALDYMGLVPGQRLAGTKVDWVFIGSCTNSRLSDLRDAEAEGLDRVFRDAGFAWRQPGCSMCVAANGERVPLGSRAVSTSNRNFVGRQGPGVRTHLASPAMAVAAAVTGAIADVRRL